MERTPVRYAVLRDHRVWEGAPFAGLQADVDGVLTLARVPGRADGMPIVHPAPYDVAPSGVAAGSNDDVYVADTNDPSIVWIMGQCHENRFKVGGGDGGAPGELSVPRGMAIASGGLYVADSGNKRVVVFRLPTLELRAVWEGVLQEPTCLARDSQDRLYVLDRGPQRVLRFDAAGVPDAAYNSAMSQHAELTLPIGLAVGGQDVLFVADEHANGVLSFDVDGRFSGSLPSAGAPASPRALAAHAERLYAADAASGWILVYQAEQGWVGRLPDYRGPVSAMTFDARGRLYVKPGLDAAYDVLDCDAAYVASGMLTAGPFDAGDLSVWERVHVAVEQPTGTSAELRLFTAPPSPPPPLPALPPPSAPANEPAEQDWTDQKTLAQSLDTLVWPPDDVGGATRPSDRYLWMRVSLATKDARVSPRLRQVQAATTAESYLDHLPAVYDREDAPDQFLARWLALFRAELGDWDHGLDDMARLFDPVTSPEETLPRLARWLAFTLPQDRDAEEWRRLLADVHRLYERRGTPFGIREFCEIYTGVRPHVFEAFRDRQTWQLGQPSSRLGFGTALAPALPDGMIVPGFTYADPSYSGLRGDYYAGTNFDRLKLTRIDLTVGFDQRTDSPAPGAIDGDYFSVRWTGQLQTRYSELHTFRTVGNNGVRLWIEGQLVIDDWHNQDRTENTGQITLTAGRWYTITLEYFDFVSKWSMSLFWSSRSQRSEIIPQACLYAIVDEGAALSADAGASSAGPMLVGQTVVGDSGPLPAADFGTPLFSDTAYLFTVVVPAATLPTLAQRDRLKQVIDAEKPAHTDVHLCFVDARMRVGFQARVGIDAIVAGAPDPMALDETSLGLNSVLGDGDSRPAEFRLDRQARVGRDTFVS